MLRNGGGSDGIRNEASAPFGSARMAPKPYLSHMDLSSIVLRVWYYFTSFFEMRKLRLYDINILVPTEAGFELRFV